MRCKASQVIGSKDCRPKSRGLLKTCRSILEAVKVRFAEGEIKPRDGWQVATVLYRAGTRRLGLLGAQLMRGGRVTVGGYEDMFQGGSKQKVDLRLAERGGEIVRYSQSFGSKADGWILPKAGALSLDDRR